MTPERPSVAKAIPRIALNDDTGWPDDEIETAADGFKRIEVHGRGATHFQSACDWIAESRSDPSAVVYATGLLYSDVPRDPGVPVIWLTPKRGRTVKLGEIIHVSP